MFSSRVLGCLLGLVGLLLLAFSVDRLNQRAASVAVRSQGTPGVTEAVGAEAVRAACASYASVDHVHGYCLSRHAVQIMSVEEMTAICTEAGDWAGRCRHTWVSARQRPDVGYPIDILLESCGGLEDCLFELLEIRFLDDVYAQVERCVEWTERYEADCVDHAVQRWYFQDHTAEEVDALVRQVGPQHPDRVSRWVAAVVSCEEVGSCGNIDTFSALCEDKLQWLEGGEVPCPTKQLGHLGTVGILDGATSGPAPDQPPPAPPASTL